MCDIHSEIPRIRNRFHARQIDVKILQQKFVKFANKICEIGERKCQSSGVDWLGFVWEDDIQF